MDIGQLWEQRVIPRKRHHRCRNARASLNQYKTSTKSGQCRQVNRQTSATWQQACGLKCTAQRWMCATYFFCLYFCLSPHELHMSCCLNNEKANVSKCSRVAHEYSVFYSSAPSASPSAHRATTLLYPIGIRKWKKPQPNGQEMKPRNTLLPGRRSLCHRTTTTPAGYGPQTWHNSPAYPSLTRSSPLRSLRSTALGTRLVHRRVAAR